MSHNLIAQANVSLAVVTTNQMLYECAPKLARTRFIALQCTISIKCSLPLTRYLLDSRARRGIMNEVITCTMYTYTVHAV